LGGNNANYGAGFLDYVKSAFNPSQVSALSSVTRKLTGEGNITLIKGPPGTGKTTTVVGALNALHLRAVNEYHGKLAMLAKEMTR
jgi:senataxin